MKKIFVKFENILNFKFIATVFFILLLHIIYMLTPLSFGIFSEDFAMALYQIPIIGKGLFYIYYWLFNDMMINYFVEGLIFGNVIAFLIFERIKLQVALKNHQQLITIYKSTISQKEKQNLLLKAEVEDTKEELENYYDEADENEKTKIQDDLPEIETCSTN
ncbi:hypothetical protein Suden_0807 [Sulfurimonas denitrificans DSM 1251]|uniref:Uncharacterized protein n=1 Tax=Sulfurimonas denitrificans (strain ATCC 33889 / DSM 1251) TaxID=326298 RepID=Q30SE5_SULDN|nr:hypothetical protein [Sulfurimonas denitrificans]ABB44086.1 hypothetical protein Suden_0807 [Sulfurimonas denitrificans DSM 1251]